MINQSASKACTIKWNNGNETTFHVGYNSNTGATIVWQSIVWASGRKTRSSRITGGNITKLAAEIAAISPDEATFVYCDAAAMAAIA